MSAPSSSVVALASIMAWRATRDSPWAVLPCGYKEKNDDRHLKKALKVNDEARRKLDVYVRHSGSQSPVHPEYVAATLESPRRSGRHIHR